MLKKGFESGCLIVISDNFKDNHQNILESIKSLAEQEWIRYDSWTSTREAWQINTDTFGEYYQLNRAESKAFMAKSSMPKTFVKKYYDVRFSKTPWNMIRKIPNVLYHKKSPNTETELREALKNHTVYEVECNICGRHYFMDEDSITCVNWRSCTGADCLSHTVTYKSSSFKNYAVINENSETLQVLNTQLALVENISNPLSYYGGTSDLSVTYISDIHLLHHLPPSVMPDVNALKTLIRATIRNLYKTMANKGIIIFDGDTSSNPIVTMKFYEVFVKYNDLLEYKDKKKHLLSLQRQQYSAKKYICKLEAKIKRLEQYIEVLKSNISEYLEFEYISWYKSKYHEYDSWVTTINAYKLVKSYVSKGISEKCNPYLDLFAQKMDLLGNFNGNYFSKMREYELLDKELCAIKNFYSKSVNDLKIKDIYTEHHLLTEKRDIFVVLGNHEYIGFNSVQEAVAFFDKNLTQLGIKLLQNTYLEINNINKPCVIFGGTGFAKYNTRYNAETLKCCKNFTREIEIKETTIFENAYIEAKQFAKNRNASFICVSHYPISDCLNNLENDTIYFYGHNHQNYYHRNENEMIYADNQIGYKNQNIEFKTMSIGLERNPYFSLSDGLYETAISDYLQFYRYIGEYIGDGALLYQRCQNDKASMYVIKRKGYYGFFILNKNAGASMGISIVNGGKTKKIAKSTDLQWVFDNFEVVLSRYLQVLTPLRQAQEKISKELKELGLFGTIHGCIVDVDSHHHIMLNPVDGTMTYYYSSVFGMVQTLSSFDSVILSMQKNDVGFASSNRDYNSLQKMFNQMKKEPSCILSKVNKSYLLSNDGLSEFDIGEQAVSRSEGMYGLSRKINPLQRLFSGHVLRDFDLNLVEMQSLEEINNEGKKTNL